MHEVLPMPRTEYVLLEVLPTSERLYFGNNDRIKGKQILGVHGVQNIVDFSVWEKLPSDKGSSYAGENYWPDSQTGLLTLIDNQGDFLVEAMPLSGWVFSLRGAVPTTHPEHHIWQFDPPIVPNWADSFITIGTPPSTRKYLALQIIFLP